MGCFGGSSDGFSCLWIIIILIIIFCLCGNDGFFGGFGGSDFLKDNCEWLVVLAVILLIFFLSNDCDDCRE
jgi:hypothetical protein